MVAITSKTGDTITNISPQPLSNSSDPNALVEKLFKTLGVEEYLKKMEEEKKDTNRIFHSLQNMNEAFSKIQDLYTVKYKLPNGPNCQVDALGKSILLKYNVDDSGILEFENPTIIDNYDKTPQTNEIIITPTFGTAERRYILKENNPDIWGWFGFRLDKREDTIAQDRLPIRKIFAELNTNIIFDMKLRATVDAAVRTANQQFFNDNGTISDRLKRKWPNLGKILPE